MGGVWLKRVGMVKAGEFFVQDFLVGESRWVFCFEACRMVRTGGFFVARPLGGFKLVGFLF